MSVTVVPKLLLLIKNRPKSFVEILIKMFKLKRISKKYRIFHRDVLIFIFNFNRQIRTMEYLI